MIIRHLCYFIFYLNTAFMNNNFFDAKYRLTRDVIPTLYEIKITPYLRENDGEMQFTFDGQVNITLLTITDQIGLITLHKKFIEILEANLYDKKENVFKLDIKLMYYDPITDKLEIFIPTLLELGENYILNIKYRGQIRNGKTGFYRATNDNVHWYGLTHLFGIEARTVFPCFDEPEFKAKFRMQISRNPDYYSYFNTRRITVSKDGERTIDHFEETPSMSTHSVAFLIGDFRRRVNHDFITVITDDPDCTTDELLYEKTDFVLEMTLKALQCNYTHLPYDMLGNPAMIIFLTENIPSSGFGNWGLVFYKDYITRHESDDDASWWNEQKTIMALFHETAKIWFGDSVTPKWWSYYWLNNGLCTYYQYFLADKAFPEYSFDQQFLADELYTAFDLDARIDSLPLTSLDKDINTPEQIVTKLSKISSSKGAAIIRMIKNLMGEENFDKAIRAYLEENQLKVTTPYHLIEQLINFWPVTHILSLEEFLLEWTVKPGYPVVSVTINDSGFYVLKQQRFLLKGNDGRYDSQLYTIPITYTTNNFNNFKNLTPQFYLSKYEQVFSTGAADKWIVLNNQQSNYHRVFYDKNLLRKLKKALSYEDFSGIDVRNRASIIDDLFAYAHNGILGYEDVFNFILYLKFETEFLPWKAAFKGFETIYKRLTWHQQQKFGVYIVHLMENIFSKLILKSNNATVLNIYNRNNVISWFCRYKQDYCNDEIEIIFQTNTTLDSDFREFLSCAAVRNDFDPVYGALKDVFFKENITSEQEKILRAMGCTRHFVQEHYEFLLTKNVSQPLKLTGLMSLYSQTYDNVKPVFKLMIKNVEVLKEALQDWSAVAKLINNIAEYFTTEEELLLLINFTFEKGELFGPSKSTLLNAMENVNKNLRWSAKHLQKLTNFLDKYKSSFYRLTRNVIPRIYEIYVTPYLLQEDGDKRFTMDGEVYITVGATKENVKEIRLHKENMEILKAILYDSKKKMVEKISNEFIIEESTFSTFIVALSEPLKVNISYVLYLKYEAKIADDMKGVFKDTYDNVNWYAITHLQPNYARRVFPCFDEPQFKAKFRWHIKRSSNYTSVSNTRLLNTSHDSQAISQMKQYLRASPKYYVDNFEETPLMSTYLNAFLVSNFDIRGNEDFKLIVHPEFKNKTKFAYEEALKILTALNKYTEFIGLAYNRLGNSIMQVAGTKNFITGGMENWGLVILIDSSVIQEPNCTDGFFEKTTAVPLITHEFAHMWFGNSVTPKWWSYVWLSEGLATYFEYLVTHQLHPEWKLDKQFLVNIHDIFDIDSKNSTLPLTSSEEIINTQLEIEQQFGVLSYYKGAAIIRMFANLMKRATFDTAVRSYLREYHLKTVEPRDLFKHLKKMWPPRHEVDLDTFFKDWTEQAGYPVVRVTANLNGTFTLTQERFLTDPHKGNNANLRYTIPITYNSNKKTNYDDLSPVMYFNKTLETVEIDNKGNQHDWILLNAQQSNYFRVLYDSDLLAKLQKAFQEENHSGIPASNRAAVINDLLALARSEYIKYIEVFKFLEYLSTETDFLPLETALKGFQDLSYHLPLSYHQELGSFIKDVLENAYNKLGFDKANDTLENTYNRNNIIKWLCRYDDQVCNEEAQRLFRLHMSNHTKPKSDFRETLYCAAVRNDKNDIYDNLKKMFQNETLLIERRRILHAMSCTRHEVNSHYEFILSDHVEMELKTTALFNLFSNNPENIMTVFQLMIEDIEKLKEAYQSWSGTANAIRELSVPFLTTHEQRIMLAKFIEKKGNLFGSSVDTLRELSADLDHKLEWSEKHLSVFSAYFQQRSVGGNSSTILAICIIVYISLCCLKFRSIDT